MHFITWQKSYPRLWLSKMAIYKPQTWRLRMAVHKLSVLCLQVGVTVCCACRLGSQCVVLADWFHSVSCWQVGVTVIMLAGWCHSVHCILDWAKCTARYCCSPTPAPSSTSRCVIKRVCWPVISQSLSAVSASASLCIQCVLSKLCLL